MGFAEIPNEPQMRESVESAQGIGHTKFRLEDDTALQRGDKSALTRNAELAVEIGVNVRDRFHSRMRNIGQESKRAHAVGLADLVVTADKLARVAAIGALEPLVEDSADGGGDAAVATL